MPTIPNFPDDLTDQHHHWHDPSAHPGAGPGRVHAMGSAGGGVEFLTFHRNFMAQVLAWYNATTFVEVPFDNATQKADMVKAWSAVPPELQVDPAWPVWADDAQRLDTGTPDFGSADELGTFIETGIHNNFIHGATAAAFNEPTVQTLHSPQSTYFYKIHGLVDLWWSSWQRRHKRWVKELIKEASADVKRFTEEVFEQKRRVPDVKDRIADVKMISFDVPDDWREQVVDPVELASVRLRLQRLEQSAFPRKAFIKPMERPPVAEKIMEQPDVHQPHD
jgi:hypothetical protein